MAKSTHRRLRDLSREEENLVQRLERIQSERKELVAPLRTKMINAFDRGLTAVLEEYLEVALSHKFAPADFEGRVRSMCIEFFSDRADRTEKESTAPITASVVSEVVDTPIVAVAVKPKAPKKSPYLDEEEI